MNEIFLIVFPSASVQFNLRDTVISFLFIICSSDRILTPEDQKEDSNYILLDCHLVIWKW